MRKGKSGQWRSELSDEKIGRFEAWERRWLEGSDLKFEYTDWKGYPHRSVILNS